MYVVRSEKAQAIKMCQQFLWLFLRVWLQAKRDREKKEKETNINRYLYLYLQTTIKQKNTTTSGTLDFCAFPAVVTRIQPSQVTQPGWLSFAFGLPFMAFVFW